MQEPTRQSDPPDFQVLVDLHYASLFRFAMTLTRHESAAADLVQETFLTWAQKGHALRDASAAKSWLFTTLHRAFLQSQRRILRFPQVTMEDAEPELPALDADAIRRLEEAQVLDFLSRLDPEFRSAVALFYLEDHSYQQIAEITEVPLGTVKSRIARGLRQLRHMIEKAETARGAS